MRHPLRNMIYAGLLFLASGALLSASNETSERHEVELALSKHVQAGVTDADQIIQRFGEPAVRESVRGPGRSEVLGYNHEAVAPTGFGRLPLISSLRSQHADTYFEITDGVVTRYWTEM